MKSFHFLVLVALALALAIPFASAFDPSPLQDFCVAIPEPKNAVFVNGKFCKNPNLTVADDFFTQGFDISANTTNRYGSTLTLANVDRIPGLNTLGISLSRTDYAPNGGLYPPHTHPRATEILVVIEGTLYVGFITSDPNNRLISKVLYPGDVFVFPFGLIHFQFNIAKTKAVTFSGFSSQNPDIIYISNAIFGAEPLINPDVLAKAFQLDKDEVRKLQELFHNA